MNAYDAAETAYKNGYKQGQKDALAEEKHGRWIIHSVGKGKHATNYAVCSECSVCGSPTWKRCPVCEAKMDLPKITPATDEALQKMGENAHGGNNG